MSYRGDPVAFELSSSDASTAKDLVIRDNGGTTRTLASDERLVITAVTAVLASGANPAVIFSDDDDDGAIDGGERMVVLGTGVNNMTFECGVAAKKGSTVKVKASGAGQIDIAGVGYVMKG